MRRYSFLFFLLTLFFSHQMQAVTVDQVELQDQALYDSDDHYYGGDLTLINHSPHPMYASISILKQENVTLNVDTGVIRLDPAERHYLGRIQQVDFNQDWSYQTELYVRPDCDLPRQNNSPACSAEHQK